MAKSKITPIAFGKTKWVSMPKCKKAMLKKRKSVICCNKKQELADRAKYGVSSCDAYGFYGQVGDILANALFQYIADAREHIIRDDWDEIEDHAQAIRDFASANSWDGLSKKEEVKRAYLLKEVKFKQAMMWLAENWQSLWW